MPGEPIPMNVLAEMQRHIDEEPWDRREQMFSEMNWEPYGTPWVKLPIRDEERW